MPTLRIYLFGNLSIRGESRSLEHLAATRASEVLCYLLLHQQAHHTREHLAEVLWDGLPIAQARKHLRQALWRLQATFDAVCGDATTRILTVDADWIHIVLDDDVWLDVDAFARAYQGVRGIGGEALDSDQVEALRSAEALYHGDLLEGWDQPWCLVDRERFHAMHLGMLDKLMAACEERHAYEEAVDFGQHILRFDRAHEVTHRRLMRLYYLIGDRTSALRQFVRCVDALHEELDVRPSERTEVLHRQIRADRPAVVRSRPEPRPFEVADPLLDLLHRLDQIQADLDGVRHGVHQLLWLDHEMSVRPAANGHRKH